MIRHQSVNEKNMSVTTLILIILRDIFKQVIDRKWKEKHRVGN